MDFCSFYDAWKYLTENEMFFDDYGQFCVDDCFRMTVEKMKQINQMKKIKLLLGADHLVLLDIQKNLEIMMELLLVLDSLSKKQ